MEMKKTVFITEDEVMTSMMIKEYLEMQGFEVLRPSVSGEDAVQRVLVEKPDAVLMDIRLAGAIDGIEAAAEIRQELNIPIIFMSGYSSEDYSERLAMVQSDGFLSKPLILRNLNNVLRSALKM